MLAESVQILHAHYQDTVARLKSKEKDRQFYLAVTGTLTLIAIVDALGSDGRSLFLVALHAAVGREVLTLSAPVLAIALLFATAVYAQLYFQSDVWIERTYKYVHGLEDELCKVDGLASIACEGRAYATNYPLFSWWTYFFYKFLIPSMLAFGVLLVPIRVFIQDDIGLGALLLLCLASTLTLVSATLYLGFFIFGSNTKAR